MFTGIITDVGVVREATRQGDGDLRLVVATGFDMQAVALGASIACSGVCLTVVEKGIEKGDGWFAADVSAESCARTTIAHWQVGRRINLERSLKLGDELGGHLVYGHVDGLARVVSAAKDGDSTRWVFEAPAGFEGFVAAKGSVAIDGVSLTVNEVDGQHFGINVIPHTSTNTTFAGLSVGDQVNFEADMLARYVARLLATQQNSTGSVKS
jgi:riboflavin synthase